MPYTTDALHAAFASRAHTEIPEAMMRTDCMVAVLGELDLLHALVALETEGFVSDWLSRKHASDESMPAAYMYMYGDEGLTAECHRVKKVANEAR